MRKNALKAFGRVLMERVRDQAITDGEMLIDGKWKDAGAVRLADALKSLSSEQRAVLLDLVRFCVDATLHHLLWMLDQEEWIDVAVRLAKGTVPSIREVSDGLVGEKENWISQYSKKPPAI